MKKLLFVPLLFIAMQLSAQDFPYMDSSLPIEDRVSDLISRMTVEEKISQMTNQSAAIPRLGVQAYEWWNECLHGVARSKDMVTVFPQAIGLAATFDAEAMQAMADIIATEGRAIYNEETRNGRHGERYKGLTFWTPNINIFRDPRWGRGQETYGEDPYLTGLIGSAMVKGLQGDDENYLKASACAKHFAVHSGPEHNRHSFDITVSKRDLWDTYLTAFRELVINAKVSSIMCAYNRYQGQPCCASDILMRSILLNNWGFKGYTTGDCGAISDFYRFHKTHENSVTASADGLLHGTDVDCGSDYRNLIEAYKQGLVTEAQIDNSLSRLIATRIKLGMFDKFGEGPYDNIPYSILEAPAHKKQALKMARESMVLLKNNGQLPLKKIRSVALIGPNSDNEETQLANYHGIPTVNTTVLDALRAEGITVVHRKGSDLVTPIDGVDFDEIVNECKKVDAIIYCGGISARLEGEAGDAGNDMIEGFAGGDRSSINLPAIQKELITKLAATKKPIILVNMSGSAIAFGEVEPMCDAIIQAWYGGQETGNAVCDILFGKYNPSGRLPITFYNSDDDLPDYEDYTMEGRTYRYFDGKVAYPFGFGLSYTTFAYSNLKVEGENTTSGDLTVSVDVTNSGKVAGDEVAQLYISNREISDISALSELRGVQRVSLQPKETKRVTFTLPSRGMAHVTAEGDLVRTAGDLKIFVGGCNPTSELAVPLKNGPSFVSTTVSVSGDAATFEL